MKKSATVIILGTVGLLGMLIAIYFFSRPKQSSGGDWLSGLLSEGLSAGAKYAAS